MPASTWRQICGDILASATYVINWRLASQSVDYFAGTEPSPVQHFWSLAVEEQYYLVWPLLIGLVVLATRGAVHRRRLAIGMALLCVIVPSLAWSIHATTTDPAKACPTENCPPVIGNVLVYRDDKHVSKLFADSMLPIVRARLVPHLAAAANTR
ncbi:acyltransferase [Yimella sp. cx-51]|uniref:acyltransferase n=1 Tax=Yimella sp. cx-51 TaxID=2770551 RepID=UPI001AD85DA0|nr:acyltransferase [Yimella sp. cx-51]QTH39151.1 acyltransferase [Yimella sp. cx-51]